MTSLDKTSLANWSRTKPEYNFFLYKPEGRAALSGDGSVLDESEHPITHVTFDFFSGEYTFHNANEVVYTCTDNDQALDLELHLWTEK